jgi:hypothetical protein
MEISPKAAAESSNGLQYLGRIGRYGSLLQDLGWPCPVDTIEVDGPTGHVEGLTILNPTSGGPRSGHSIVAGSLQGPVVGRCLTLPAALAAPRPISHRVRWPNFRPSMAVDRSLRLRANNGGLF